MSNLYNKTFFIFNFGTSKQTLIYDVSILQETSTLNKTLSLLLTSCKKLVLYVMLSFCFDPFSWTSEFRDPFFSLPLGFLLLNGKVRFFWSWLTKSLQIEWSVKGGTLRNINSARLSIPSTLKYDESKKW